MKRIAIITSGGDAPGMNPAIHAISRTARQNGLDVIGVNRGYTGLIDGDFRILDDHAVSGIGRRGGTILGTSRSERFKTAEGQALGVKQLEAQGVDGVVVIGGDGSLTGANALHKLGVPVIGLPGTIDNDLAGTDLGIGVDTALNTIMSLVDMIKDTASSHERCFVVEVMGRGSGYLAAMATISTQSHVAVIPEFPMNMEKIVGIIERRFREKLKYTVIILAEGVCSAREFDAQLVAACEGVVQNDIRETVLGHVQRGGPPSHYDRLLASELGQRAVRELLSGASGQMVGKMAGENILTDFNTVLACKPVFKEKVIRLAKNIGVEIGAP